MSLRRVLLLLCGGLFLLATSAFAGEPIPGVDVELGKNPGGLAVATGKTNREGMFMFSDVAVGSYRVSVDAGAKGRATKTFTLRIASPVQVTVTDNAEPGKTKATGITIIVYTPGG